MESNISFLIIICLLGISFYYYTKAKNYENRHYMDDKEFYILNKHIEKLAYENANYKVRIRDLQKYKNDVSKTFKILDNELVHINNHVEKNSQLSRNTQELNNHISLLTPDMLNNLLDNMNQDFINVTTIGNINITDNQDTNYNNDYNINNDNNTNNNDYNTNNNDYNINNDNNNYNTNNNDYNINNDNDNNNDNTNNNNNINIDNQPRGRVNTILRSLSFPNLPSTYQRLMLPIIQSNSLTEQQMTIDEKNNQQQTQQDTITSDEKKNEHLVENE